jgi:hypothetical protein
MNDIEICSNASVRLGSAAFAAFDAGTNPATASAVIYPRVKASALSKHNWHFAVRQAQLSLSGTPGAKWTYQYVLPVDVLTSAPMEMFQSLTSTVPYKEWEVVGSTIQSSSATLWAVYVADVDEDDMPAYFVEFLIKAMMAELVIPVLGKDNIVMRQALMEEVWGDFGDYQKAKTADSRNHPPRIYQDFSLISARWGGMEVDRIL